MLRDLGLLQECLRSQPFLRAATGEEQGGAQGHDDPRDHETSIGTTAARLIPLPSDGLRVGTVAPWIESSTAGVRAAMPYARRALGIEMLAASPDEVKGRVAWEERLTTAGGLLHGGAVMALADSAGGVCAFLNLPEGAGTSTIESKTNFLGAVKQGTITATARPLHVGSSTIVVETEVRRRRRQAVGKVTQTQAVL